MTPDERELLITVARLLRAHLTEHAHLGIVSEQDEGEGLTPALRAVYPGANPDNDHF